MIDYVTKDNPLFDILDQIEIELKQLTLWQETPPDQKALASTLPFCVDTLSFTEWLQWLYIPRLRTLLLYGQPLPDKSAITPYAEQILGEQGTNGKDYRRLIQLMTCSDQVFNAESMN